MKKSNRAATSTKPTKPSAKPVKPAAPAAAKAKPKVAQPSPVSRTSPVKPTRPAPPAKVASRLPRSGAPKASKPAAAVPSPTRPVDATKKSPVGPSTTTKPKSNGTPGIILPFTKPSAATKPAATKPVVPLAPFKATPRPEPVIAADKDITTRNKSGVVKDRLVLMVPEPYWIHAVWEISHSSVLRAESALGPDWHGAKPIIRVFDVTALDTTSTSESPIRDITIHGGVSHWHIDVPQPPRSYRADIGYVSRRGQFYMIARSNVATPPKSGSTEIIDDSTWASDVQKAGGAERVLAMSTGFETSSGPPQLKEFFEETFKKAPKEGMFGAGAMPNKLKKFHFDIDAELIVFGRTEPNATVTLQNERVPLRPDGTFTMRFSLPDSRQIIPAVSTSADGLEEQTIVLAVERNIKRLEVTTHEMNSEV